jgi:D-sedoheptulose 7-phosphate isomerase
VNGASGGGPSGGGPSGGGSSGGIESLYPFLYSSQSDVDAVLEEVRRSTAEKAREIVALRNEVRARFRDRLVECAEAMASSFALGGKLFACGNGGSSTDAQDAATLFLAPPGGVRPLPAFALTSDIAVVTALSNDIGFEVVFARQIAAFGREGDLVMGLSTSGNSENLVRAFEEAGRRGLVTVGLAGYEGGKMAELDTIDYLFVVPSASVHRIQEAQTTIYHVLWELTQRALEQGHTRLSGSSRTERAP